MLTRDPILRSFGLKIRRQREVRKFTQEKLAEKADLHPTYISGIERGIRNPTILNISKIAKALGVTVSQLTNGIRE